MFAWIKDLYIYILCVLMCMCNSVSTKAVEGVAGASTHGPLHDAAAYQRRHRRNNSADAAPGPTRTATGRARKSAEARGACEGEQKLEGESILGKSPNHQNAKIKKIKTMLASRNFESFTTSPDSSIVRVALEAPRR